MGGVTRNNTANSVKDIFLAIETSGYSTGVALITGDSVLFETVEDTAARHNEVLLTLINEAFGHIRLSSALGSQLSAIDYLAGIFLTIGPGMFTSLRVGLSVAKGLALARQIPLKGVNTLLALSTTGGQVSNSPYPVLALIDARKQELYAGFYLMGRPCIPPAVISPFFIPEWLSNVKIEYPKPLILVGDGTKLVEPFLRQAGIDFITTGVTFPSVKVVARLGMQLLKDEGPDSLQLLEPLYLRRTDAELKREKEKGVRD
ncbi:MAG: tRNA (adenosine(37)-N6)-threonylcarbamoyltransferase complex dimerization subunit type 1 TsaB [candidate division WOR-3 bacterium]